MQLTAAPLHVHWWDKVSSFPTLPRCAVLGLSVVCCRAAGLCTHSGAARSAAPSPTIPRFDVPVLLPALWDLCCSPAGMGQIPPVGPGWVSVLFEDPESCELRVALAA